MKKFIAVILIACLASFTPLNSTINIRNKWKTHVCPRHNQKLIKGKVKCVVGGFAGIQAHDSRDYNDAPYKDGEYPNAKYNYFLSRGCILLYEYALIYYCETCEYNCNND